MLTRQRAPDYTLCSSPPSCVREISAINAGSVPKCSSRSVSLILQRRRGPYGTNISCLLMLATCTINSTIRQVIIPRHSSQQQKHCSVKTPTSDSAAITFPVISNISLPKLRYRYNKVTCLVFCSHCMAQARISEIFFQRGEFHGVPPVL